MTQQGDQVNKTRTDAVTKILADLEAFEIDHQAYFDDAEPQGWYDAALTGKVKSLLAFFRVLGWSELVSSMEGLLPVQGDAPAPCVKLL